jgi:hypothetical protein
MVQDPKDQPSTSSSASKRSRSRGPSDTTILQNRPPIPKIIIQKPPEDEIEASENAGEICCICLTDTNIMHLVKVPKSVLNNAIKPVLNSCGISIDKEEVVQDNHLIHLGMRNWFENSGLTLKIFINLFTLMAEMGWDFISYDELGSHESLTPNSNSLSVNNVDPDQPWIQKEFVTLYFANNHKPDLNSKFFGFVFPYNMLEDPEINLMTVAALENLKQLGVNLHYDMEFIVTEIAEEDYRNFVVWIFKSDFYGTAL